MLNMSGMEGLFLKFLAMRDLDVKKTVLLFVAIHLMIAWVADRKVKQPHSGTSFIQHAVDINNEKNGTHYELIAKQP